MLNLLYIVLFLFTGSITEADFIAGWELRAEPAISVYEIVNDELTDNVTTILNIEIEYYLTIDSTDFEIDSGYNNQYIFSDIYEFEYDDTYIYDLANLTIFIEFDNIVIDYGVYNNQSYIEVSLYNYVETDLTLIDNTDIVTMDEHELAIYNYTNFTIYNDNIIMSSTPNIITLYYNFVETYQDGYDVGYEDGYDTGFRNGEDYGYEQGSNDLSNVFNGSWVEWLGNAITGFFALEIFPNFTLGGAIGAIVVVWIWLWILKLFAGG